MANSPQARKRARQAEKRRRHNSALRSMTRTYIKRVLAAVDTGDGAAAQNALTDAIPVIDKMVNKGILHKNQAARHKSRLTARVRALSA